MKIGIVLGLLFEIGNSAFFFQILALIHSSIDRDVMISADFLDGLELNESDSESDDEKSC